MLGAKKQISLPNYSSINPSCWSSAIPSLSRGTYYYTRTTISASIIRLWAVPIPTMTPVVKCPPSCNAGCDEQKSHRYPQFQLVLRTKQMLKLLN